MPRPELNYMQNYLVEEFVEDYHEGRMPRREMVARVLSVTGGVAATATLLLSLGCAPTAPPAATAAPAKPTEAPKAAAPAAAPSSPTTAATAAAKPTAAATSAVSPTTAPMAAASPTAGAAATKPAGSPAAGTPGTGPTNTPAPVPTPIAARSKLSVKADDPAITAADVTFPGDGVSVMAYLAQPKGGASATPAASMGSGTPTASAGMATPAATAAAKSSGSTALRAVLVCHENRGLTEHIRDVTRRLAKAGYVALAVDLLSRDGGTAKVDPAQVPGKLGDPTQQVSDFQAGLKYLQAQSFVAKDKIGMVGFCFGGGVTWLVAVNTPDLKAAVTFYGPPPPAADIAKVKAAVLAIYAGNDQRITATADAAEAAMRQNGKAFEKIIYPNVGHAFHNDTGSSWDEAAATDAWAKALAWFDKYLV